MSLLAEKRWWYLLLAAILILAGMWINLSRLQPAAGQEIAAHPYTGFRAPDFSLGTLEGNVVSLSDLHGQVVVINFWATWCTPCRLEMPALEHLHQELGSDGVVVLGVNTTHQDSPSAAADFVEERELTFPILLDVENIAGSAYEVQATPTTFVIDREGVIRFIQIGGPLDEAFLFSEAESLLEEMD